LEILKRARGREDGDITSFKDEPDKDEINRRTWKAGYTNREGGPPTTGRIISKPANAQYRKNYRRIFGHD